MSSDKSVRVVWFDFGFTLWNEERAWKDWAEWLETSTLEFFALLGCAIERREHHHHAFQMLRPGIDMDRERALRNRAGRKEGFRPDELYPDVLTCLRELKAAGYRTGVAGNHFADFADTLRGMNLPLDFIGSSEEWGFEKPSQEFFRRIVEVSGVTANEIAYVGDRLDNDVLPANAAGMLSVFLPRGPWGLIHSRRPEAQEARIQIQSLTELPRKLPALNKAHPPARPKGFELL